MSLNKAQRSTYAATRANPAKFPTTAGDHGSLRRPRATTTPSRQAPDHADRSIVHEWAHRGTLTPIRTTTLPTTLARHRHRG